MVWIIGILLAGLAVFGVVWPLSRRRTPSVGEGLESRFYLSQIAAIDADLSSALIAEPDARIAKTEAARRALAGSAQAQAQPATRSPRLGVATALAVLVFIPAVSFGLYRYLGSPTLRDEPLAPRLEAEHNKPDIFSLLQKLEAHLQQDPQDGKGFALIAPVYLRMDRTTDAVNAFHKALKLLGETPDRRADYAEALIAQAKGIVTPTALASLNKAAALDPKHAKSNYYLGLAAAQAGEKDQALEIWQKLLAQAPPNAIWIDIVRAKIGQLNGAPDANSRLPSPSAAAVASVSAMAPNQRLSFIHSMVDGLAKKLSQNGDDPAGWQRLLRALVVLKDQPRAQSTLKDARKALAGNQDGLTQVNSLALQLGVTTP